MFRRPIGIACALLWGTVTGIAADPAAAQVTRGHWAAVEGRVVVADSARPLSDVHVFIAESMIGAVTKADGSFYIGRVPAGHHTLYVSALGFAPVRIDTLFRANTTYRFEIELHEVVLEGPEVIVTAERDPTWYRRLRKFERLFVGESPNASECTIQNPEVLSFDARWWGRLTAHAREPIEIINLALGYRVLYFLEEFESAGGTIRWDGEPFFEELEPVDSVQATRWREARRAAYYGSYRHFMQSLLRGTHREEGFYAYRVHGQEGGIRGGTRFGLQRDDILQVAPDSTQHVLDFRGFVEVMYPREPVDDAYLRWRRGTTWYDDRVQRSFFELTDGPAHVDARGEIVEPYGVTVYGYFAYERIADLVPKEYEP